MKITVTWNKLIRWLERPYEIPLGWTLEYEWHPTGFKVIDNYKVHPEYYKLEQSTFEKLKEKYTKWKYSQFSKTRANNPANFLYQKITWYNGENYFEAIMDRNGIVKFYQKVKKQIEINVSIPI